MTNRILFCAALYLSSVAVHAAPSVSGNTISWPDDGWYQVQNTSDYSTVCNGGTSCVVEPGIYKVINHTTGEKFRGVEVTGPDASGPNPGGSPSSVSVNGNVISWPDDGWYQVQNTRNYMTVCSGGTSCEVEPGTYKVINHSTGEKFRGIEVSGSSTSGPSTGGSTDGVSVTGNVISWPDDGWYQVQNTRTYATVCNGSTSCVVEPGTYKVINHTTGEKFRGIEVSGSDPLVQNRTLVNFDITVPMYQSNALQVRLNWGDTDITAQWIGDEMWSASTEISTNTENLLTVFFYDDNGDIELGSYERTFRTGSTTAESIRITADQFDTDRWDSDSDGVSNLRELINGDDPLKPLSDTLEIRDRFVVGLDTWHIDVDDVESKIPTQRPYFEDTYLLIPDRYFEDGKPNPDSIGENYRTIIDLDEFGTGTFYYQLRDQFSPSYFESFTHSATRTNTGDSMILDISASRFHIEARIRYSNEISTVTTITDEGHRFQTGVLDGGNNYDSFNGRSKIITYALTGRVDPDSTNCEAIAGYLEVKERPYTGQVRRIFTVNKELGDEYWTRSVTDLDGQSLGDDVLFRNISVPFYCDFPELR